MLPQALGTNPNPLVSSEANALPTLNALTIDVEDYFHVSGFENCVDRANWPTMPSRVGYTFEGAMRGRMGPLRSRTCPSWSYSVTSDSIMLNRLKNSARTLNAALSLIRNTLPMPPETAGRR